MKPLDETGKRIFAECYDSVRKGNYPEVVWKPTPRIDSQVEFTLQPKDFIKYILGEK